MKSLRNRLKRSALASAANASLKAWMEERDAASTRRLDSKYARQLQGAVPRERSFGPH